MRVCVLFFAGLAAVVSLGTAQGQSLPTEVTEPYVIYTEALEAGRYEDARDAALQAWRAAERADIDGLTVATLADNYATLALQTGDYEAAVRAYRATAQLLDDIGSEPYIVSETWVYAAHAALAGEDFAEARRCADAAGDIAENAEGLAADVRASLLFNSRAIQATANWLNGNVRAAYVRAGEAIEAAGDQDFSDNSYYALLTFVMGASHTLMEDEEEAAYWLTIAYHHFSAQRHALSYWSRYAREKLDEEQQEALLDRLALVELPEVTLDENEQAEAAERAEREALLESGELIDAEPVSRPTPRYPRNLNAGGIEGTALIQFAINEEGRAEDIEVLASIPYVDFGEAGVFAIERWEYTPAIQDGEPVRREGVVTEFRFILSDW